MQLASTTDTSTDISLNHSVAVETKWNEWGAVKVECEDKAERGTAWANYGTLDGVKEHDVISHHTAKETRIHC